MSWNSGVGAPYVASRANGHARGHSRAGGRARPGQSAVTPMRSLGQAGIVKPGVVPVSRGGRAYAAAYQIDGGANRSHHVNRPSTSNLSAGFNGTHGWAGSTSAAMKRHGVSNAAAARAYGRSSAAGSSGGEPVTASRARSRGPALANSGDASGVAGFMASQMPNGAGASTLSWGMPRAGPSRGTKRPVTSAASATMGARHSPQGLPTLAAPIPVNRSVRSRGSPTGTKQVTIGFTPQSAAAGSGMRVMQQGSVPTAATGAAYSASHRSSHAARHASQGKQGASTAGVSGSSLQTAPSSYASAAQGRWKQGQYTADLQRSGYQASAHVQPRSRARLSAGASNRAEPTRFNSMPNAPAQQQGVAVSPQPRRHHRGASPTSSLPRGFSRSPSSGQPSAQSSSAAAEPHAPRQAVPSSPTPFSTGPVGGGVLDRSAWPSPTLANALPIHGVQGAAAVTLQGHNPSLAKPNQDRFILASDVDTGTLFIAVFDGHGSQGHHVSNWAATRAASLAVRDPRWATDSAVADVLSDALLAAELSLLQAGTVDTSLSGSTAVLCAFRNGRLYAASCGDSRAVLGGPGPAGQVVSDAVTVDHKPDAPAEKARILAAGGRVMATRTRLAPHFVGPARVWLRDLPAPGLAMSRSLGDMVAKAAGVVSTPDRVMRKLQGPAHRWLVVASDGLWDFVQNNEVMTIVESSGAPAEAADALARVARMRWLERTGGADDTTIVVVRFDH